MFNQKNNIILEAHNISKNFGNKTVLKNITLSLKTNEIKTIMGPNGAGKSTLAKILLGIIQPDQGNITKRDNLNISYMPQISKINNNIPISVEYFLSLHPTRIISKQKIVNLSNDLGIKNLMNQSLHNLSGGETKKVFLAKSLIDDPDLLILDEPEQGVDINGQIEIYKQLKQINDSKNTSILIIAHDLHFVMKSTSEVICLNQHICCEGKPQHLSNNQEYINLFGKEAAKTMSLYGHDHDHKH